MVLCELARAETKSSARCDCAECLPGLAAQRAPLNGLSAQWEGAARQVADTWTSSLQTQNHTQQQLLAGLDGALQAFTHAFEQRAAALVASVDNTHAKLQADAAQQQAF